MFCTKRVTYDSLYADVVLPPLVQPLAMSPTTMSKPSTPLTRKPPLPALQRTASESAASVRRGRQQRMELGGLGGQPSLGGGGGRLVHDALFSPMSSGTGSAVSPTVSEASVRRAFSMVQ